MQWSKLTDHRVTRMTTSKSSGAFKINRKYKKERYKKVNKNSNGHKNQSNKKKIS